MVTKKWIPKPPEPEVVWQPSLFDASDDVAPSVDASFSTIERVALDEKAWVDYAPGWVAGADRLFEQILESRDWGQRSRKMYDKTVLEPRLTAPWNARSGEPLEPPILEEMRKLLCER